MSVLGMLVGSITYPVSLDNPHIVAVDPEKKGRKCGCIDDAQPVRFSGHEWESCVLVEANGRSHWWG
jgi:hypothetical protein